MNAEPPRIALITGASRGIGQGIALSLARDGWHVVGTATTRSGADAIADAFSDEGVSIKGRVLQVRDDESVNSLVKQLTDELGAPSLLVNNAGVTKDNLLMRMKSDEWAEVLEVNLGSMYRLCKAVLRPMMRARWGRIVNIGSVVGRMGNAGQTNYAASKGGVEAFTRSLAQEVGSRSITVNAVAPGFIDTDMTAEMSDEQRARLLERVPLRRLGEVSEVAAVVSFLASDAAAYITGETIHVNGGLYMA
ncbi:MAG: 3-oxoacyl-ACP reductase FabG [Gammaproteobacteria bacterium]|nr:3-oxoacyl-ACP reductase FabG [Gammaproteobacteria bacterium]